MPNLNQIEALNDAVKIISAAKSSLCRESTPIFMLAANAERHISKQLDSALRSEYSIEKFHTWRAGEIKSRLNILQAKPELTGIEREELDCLEEMNNAI